MAAVMPRHYASHGRRVRVSIEPNLVIPKPKKKARPRKKLVTPDGDLVIDFDDDDFFGPSAPSPHEVFNALCFKDEGVSYERPWSPRDKGNYVATTRNVIVQLGGKRSVQGWLTWSSEYGISVNTNAPIPYAEKLVARVCSDMQRFYESKGFKSNPEPKETKVQREELCTWIRRNDVGKVLSNLPTLIRYAESIEWSIGPGSKKGWIVINNLALSFPRLYPVGSQGYKGHVRLDVKFYQTNRNQPMKLEFQMHLPKRKKGGDLVAERLWNDSVRATGLKLMDAFLEFCSVSSTFLSSGQTEAIRPLERLPYEPEMLADLRSLGGRADAVRGNFFTQGMKKRLKLKDADKQTQAVVGVLRSFRRVELAWEDFGKQFLLQVEELAVKKGDKTKPENIHPELKPTRKNLYHVTKGERTNTTSSRYLSALKKNLIDQHGFIEERKLSNKPALLRFTNQVF